MNEPDLLPRQDRDRPLDEAIKEFGERLCPGGPDGEIDEWSIYDESLRRLVRWAKEAGCYYQGLQPLKEGGREHDLTYDPATGSWLKFTKPAAAGYVVSFDSGAPALQPALPIEYLERLVLQNEIFSDCVKFVGVGGGPIRPRIVTRQPDVPGSSASYPQILHLMTVDLGFRLLPRRFSVGYADSMAFILDDVAVFDLRPANVVRTEDGILVPIDAIPVRLDAAAREILET